MNYFIYNGIKSSDLGVYIQNKNIFSSPKYDASFVSIPGRNGDLIASNGRYPNTSISYTCFIVAKSIEELSDKVTTVKNWLYKEPDRYHDLIDSYDVNFKRKAVFNSKLDISDEVNKIGTFTVVFSCKPQRYLVSTLEKETYTEEFVVNNPYSLNAKPYLKIYGSGDITLTISSEGTNKIWIIKNVEEFIECDSELMNFYKGTELQNGKVTGDDFPELFTGDNSIAWKGDVTKVEIIKRLVTL